MLLSTDIVPYLDAAESYTNLWEASEGASFYNSPVWLNVLEDGFKTVEILLLEVSNGERRIASLPIASMANKRLACLPLSPPVSLLIDPEFNEIEESQILSTIIDRVNETGKSTELRLNLSSDASLQQNAALIETHVISILDLQSEEEILRGRSKNVKRNVKRAKANGVSIKTSMDYRLFYEFVTRTRQRQGSPVYPYTFFEALKTANENGAPIELVFSYTENDEPVSAILLFRDGTEMTYAIGGSCEDTELMSTSANFELFSWAIEHSRNQGCTSFDFGMSSIGQQGLRRFKEQWGSKSTELQFLGLNGHKPINRNSPMVSLANSVFQKSPRFAFNALSKLLFERVM